MSDNNNNVRVKIHTFVNIITLQYVNGVESIGNQVSSDHRINKTWDTKD